MLAVQREIEKDIAAIYQKAADDVFRKATDSLARIDMASTQMTPAERYMELRKYNRFEAMSQQFGTVLADANREAAGIINGRMLDVYEAGYTEAAKIFPKGTMFPPISRGAVGKMLRGDTLSFQQMKMSLDEIANRGVIERALKREILTGIVQGESIPDLAKRIQSVVKRDEAWSTRIARTETGRVINGAKQDVAKKGTELGFRMLKRWVATNEPGRTRDEHLEADGQIVPADKPFIVGGEELMYPGDPNGSAWNVINCRCTMVTYVDRTAGKK